MSSETFTVLVYRRTSKPHNYSVERPATMTEPRTDAARYASRSASNAVLALISLCGRKIV